MITINLLEQGILQRRDLIMPDDGRIFCFCSRCNKKILIGDFFYENNFFGKVCQQCGEQIFEESRMIADEV